MKNTVSALAWITTSILVSELLGYFLHRFMHSGRVRFLSRSHMKHHLLLYGPLHPQRPGYAYRDATGGEVSLGNIGLEWLVPGALILGGAVLVFQILRVKFLHQAIFVSVSLVWSFFMFSYLHDKMHSRGFRMETNRWLRRWFLSARRAHDIHHWALNDEGLMDKNFGIGFFFFDRCFGTFTASRPVFNHRGYQAAQQRFGDMLRHPSATKKPDSGSSVLQGDRRGAGLRKELRRVSGLSRSLISLSKDDVA